MKTKYVSSYINYFFLIFLFATFNSCTPVKNVVYFQNLQKDTVLHAFVDKDFQLKIRKQDLLGITIVSPAPDITLFNAPQASSSGSASNAAPSGGYLVDDNGDIVIYKIGTVHVEGLTRNELKLKLQKALFPYLNESIVTVRFLNNRVTMLGEFVKPGIVLMPNEQISLLEAIGLSGDLTFTGRRDNILVIRETASGKQFKRLNLSDNSIFYSPYYYLKPDDIVYVEPTKYKLNNTAQNQQIVSYVLSGVSILITIFSLLRR